MSDLNNIDFGKILSGALGEYTKGNENLSGALSQFQDQIKGTQANHANLPALAFAAGLLRPTKTGSFGESVGNAGEGAIGALQQQRQIDFERQAKILELQSAKQQLLGNQLSTLQPYWKMQQAGNAFGGLFPGGGGGVSAPGGAAAGPGGGAPAGGAPAMGGSDPRAKYAGALRYAIQSGDQQAMTAIKQMMDNDPELQAGVKGKVAAAEAAAKMPYDTAAVDMQPDPNNPGSFLLINKLTGKVQHVGANPVQLPPMASPGMPTTGMPAGGGAAPSASTGPVAGGGGAQPSAAPETPQISPANDFTPPLRPEIQQRIAMLPQNNQGMVAAILEGRMAPPTGRILADPVMGPLFRQALQVDPQFDEATWTSRNKMVTGMSDTKNASMGMRIDSAKKLINHTYDLLDAAAARGQTLSPAIEAVGNTAVDYLGTGSAKGSLNRFNQAREGVGSEYVNMMTGGQGGEKDRQAVKNNLSENDPITGTVGSVGTLIDQMEGQVKPLVDQYNGIMKTNVPTDQMLGNETTTKLRAIQAIATAQRNGTPITPEIVKATLAGGGLLAPKTPTPKTLASDLQARIDEARKRGLIK